jgi:hypothetical protein
MDSLFTLFVIVFAYIYICMKWSRFLTRNDRDFYGMALLFNVTLTPIAGTVFFLIMKHLVN